MPDNTNNDIRGGEYKVLRSYKTNQFDWGGFGYKPQEGGKRRRNWNTSRIEGSWVEKSDIEYSDGGKGIYQWWRD